MKTPYATPHPKYAGVLCTEPAFHEDSHRNVNMPAERWNSVPYIVISDQPGWGEQRRHFLAVNRRDAKSQHKATTARLDREETVTEVRLATIDDAPWTIARCSPTDDPDWWKMDSPCDYDKGADRTCHHPVHAFGEPGPLRHLIDAPTAHLAAQFGWWS
jgi:hypothetical protein